MDLIRKSNNRGVFHHQHKNNNLSSSCRQPLLVLVLENTTFAPPLVGYCPLPFASSSSREHKRSKGCAPPLALFGYPFLVVAQAHKRSNGCLSSLSSCLSCLSCLQLPLLVVAQVHKRSKACKTRGKVARVIVIKTEN